MWSAAHNSKPTGRASGPRARHPDTDLVIDGQPLSNTSARVSRSESFSLRRRIKAGTRGHGTRQRSGRSSHPRATTCSTWPTSTARPRRVRARITMAWTLAHVQLFHLGIDSAEASVFPAPRQPCALCEPGLRPSSDVLTRSEADQQRSGARISGDMPIVVCRIDEIEDLQIVRQLLQAHAYWRMKQCRWIWSCERTPASYAHDLQTALEAMVRASQLPQPFGGRDGARSVFILRADLVSVECGVSSRVPHARCCSAAAEPFRAGQTSAGVRACGPRPQKRPAVKSVPAPVLARRRARVLQWPWRLRERRARVRDHPGQGQWTPCRGST